jgi:hypothetical protein
MTSRFRRNKRQDMSEAGRNTVKGLPGPLFIKDLIRHVDAELRGSQAERAESGQAPIFEVNDLVLEVNFVATKSAEAKGGIAFHIITVGGDASYQSQQVHKVTLSLSAVKEHGPGEAPVPPPDDELVELEPTDYTAFRPREE